MHPATRRNLALSIALTFEGNEFGGRVALTRALHPPGSSRKKQPCPFFPDLTIHSGSLYPIVSFTVGPGWGQENALRSGQFAIQALLSDPRVTRPFGIAVSLGAKPLPDVLRQELVDLNGRMGCEVAFWDPQPHGAAGKYPESVFGVGIQPSRQKALHSLKATNVIGSIGLKGNSPVQAFCLERHPGIVFVQLKRDFLRPDANPMTVENLRSELGKVEGVGGKVVFILARQLDGDCSLPQHLALIRRFRDLGAQVVCFSRDEALFRIWDGLSSSVSLSSNYREAIQIARAKAEKASIPAPRGGWEPFFQPPKWCGENNCFTLDWKGKDVSHDRQRWHDSLAALGGRHGLRVVLNLGPHAASDDCIESFVDLACTMRRKGSALAIVSGNHVTLTDLMGGIDQLPTFHDMDSAKRYVQQVALPPNTSDAISPLEWVETFVSNPGILVTRIQTVSSADSGAAIRPWLLAAQGGIVLAVLHHGGAGRVYLRELAAQAKRQGLPCVGVCSNPLLRDSIQQDHNCDVVVASFDQAEAILPVYDKVAGSRGLAQKHMTFGVRTFQMELAKIGIRPSRRMLLVEAVTGTSLNELDNDALDAFVRDVQTLATPDSFICINVTSVNLNNICLAKILQLERRLRLKEKSVLAIVDPNPSLFDEFSGGNSVGIYPSLFHAALAGHCKVQRQWRSDRGVTLNDYKGVICLKWDHPSWENEFMKRQYFSDRMDNEISPLVKCAPVLWHMPGLNLDRAPHGDALGELRAMIREIPHRESCGFSLGLLVPPQAAQVLQRAISTDDSRNGLRVFSSWDQVLQGLPPRSRQ